MLQGSPTYRRCASAARVRQACRRRIADRQHHVVGRSALPSSSHRNQRPSSRRNCTHGRDGARTRQSAALPRALRRSARVDSRHTPAAAGSRPATHECPGSQVVEEIAGPVAIERHLPRGDVERIRVVARRVGDARADLRARIDEHDAQCAEARARRPPPARDGWPPRCRKNPHRRWRRAFQAPRIRVWFGRNGGADHSMASGLHEPQYPEPRGHGVDSLPV